MNIFMVTRAISQVEDEGSKNLTLNLSTRIKNHKFYLMTPQNTKLPKTKNTIYCHLYPENHVFTVPKIGLLNKIKLIKCMISNHKRIDIYHFIFTPTLTTALIAYTFLKVFNKKSIQTIPTPLTKLKLKTCLFADKIITLSNWTKKRAQDLGYNNIIKINPGIDLQKISKEKIPKIRKNLKLSKTDFIILFPSEYLIERGTRTVLKILKDLIKMYPHVKMIFACRPHDRKDTQEKNFLRNTVNNLNLNTNVIFLDHVDFMLELINSSDIIIMPTISPPLKMEIPMVLLESLALEKPIIISDIPPLNEIISKSEVGIKIRPGNNEDLLKGIVKLIKDKKLKNKMGKKGRTLIKKEFNIKNVAREYKKVYEELKLK